MASSNHSGIMAAPALDAATVLRARPGAPALRHSSWHLTISTNRRIAAMPAGFVPRFRRTMERLVLEHEGVRKHLLRFRGPGTYLDGTSIRQIRTRMTLEEGGDAMGSRLHSHTLIEIQHFTRLQLNYAAIKRFVERAMGLTGVYVHADLLNTPLGLLEYIRKAPLGRGARRTPSSRRR